MRVDDNEMSDVEEVVVVVLHELNRFRVSIRRKVIFSSVRQLKFLSFN